MSLVGAVIRVRAIYSGLDGPVDGLFTVISVLANYEAESQWITIEGVPARRALLRPGLACGAAMGVGDVFVRGGTEFVIVNVQLRQWQEPPKSRSLVRVMLTAYDLLTVQARRDAVLQAKQNQELAAKYMRKHTDDGPTDA